LAHLAATSCHDFLLGFLVSSVQIYIQPTITPQLGSAPLLSPVLTFLAVIRRIKKASDICNSKQSLSWALGRNNRRYEHYATVRGMMDPWLRRIRIRLGLTGHSTEMVGQPEDRTVTFSSLQAGVAVNWSLHVPHRHRAMQKPIIPGVWRLESMETGVKKGRYVPRDAIRTASLCFNNYN